MIVYHGTAQHFSRALNIRSGTPKKKFKTRLQSVGLLESHLIRLESQHFLTVLSRAG